MSILIVDDSEDSRLLIQTFLKKEGYNDMLMAASAAEAFKILGIDGKSDYDSRCAGPQVELILMDIVMPEMDGTEACRRIKLFERLKDIPIIMVTADTKNNSLQLAFENGAIDYVNKPINKVELIARIKSALKLKFEMDRRMALSRQLEEANIQLKRLTLIDGLTGIANRRYFDEFLNNEWRRNMRDKKYLSIIMGDIDFFKNYNDTYGHQAGDACLKQVAAIFNTIAKRPGDLAARYGGEEFAVILSSAPLEKAKALAKIINKKIIEEKIPHSDSAIAGWLTVSLGVAATIPEPGKSASDLIKSADDALYAAKKEGRNRVKIFKEDK